MHSARTRAAALAGAIALTLSACGSSTPSTGDGSGALSSEAIDTTAPPLHDPLDQEVAARTAELLAMTADDQQAALAELAVAVQRGLAKASGLEAALGGEAASDAALAEAWVPTLETVVANGDAASSLKSGLRRAAPSGPNIGEGLFGGLLMVGLVTKSLVEQTNEMKPGAEPEVNNDRAIKLRGSHNEVGYSMDEVHTSSSGVTTKFKVNVDVIPCPDPNGDFTATAKIDISASKDGVGQTGTLDVNLTGHVDDNAALASQDTDFRMQWADFAGGKGQFVDLSGGYKGDQFGGFTTNRTGGNLTAGLATSAAVLGALFALMVSNYMADAAKAGWESGRCVQLEASASPGPAGLEPSSQSTITANPRSKVDGSPTGGTVTATLTAGGASVDPMSSPVPADATMTYTAPDTIGEGGTVALEARSKRGVAKADITFSTGVAAYLVAGGLQDWQVSQVVCDVTKPFTLTSDIGTMEFSGGLSGTYEFNGVFASHYTGTYQITLPTAPGQQGSMIGGGGGSIAGQAGSGSENYTLTPADPC